MKLANLPTLAIVTLVVATVASCKTPAPGGVVAKGGGAVSAPAAGKPSTAGAFSPEAVTAMVTANQGVVAFTLSLPAEDTQQKPFQLFALPPQTDSVTIEVTAGGQKVKGKVTRDLFVGGKASIVIDKLPAGPATIAVAVLDASGATLAAGTATATVVLGKITPIAITLQIKPDTGGLAITVDVQNTPIDPIVIPTVTSKGPTNSSPIALTPDDKTLLVVNPDSNTVSAIDAATGKLLASIPVGREPQSIAITPDGKKAFVAVALDGVVAVIDLAQLKVIEAVAVGVEPMDVAITPNGTKVYVSNTRSNSVSVLDAGSGFVVSTIKDVGEFPRGIAITNNGDSQDNDETVFVTQFLAVPKPGAPQPNATSSEARVTAINAGNDAITGTIPLPNGTFDAKKSLANNLGSIVIAGDRAYIAATGSLPDLPRKVGSNMTGVAGVINVKSGAAESLLSLDTPGQATVNHNIPFAIGFSGSSAYVVSAGSNVVSLAKVDGTGALALTSPAVDIAVGDDPRGIVMNAAGTKAYVSNYISRNVSVIDVATNAVTATYKSTDVPAAGTPDFHAWNGKKLFNASVDTIGTGGHLSQNGSGSCAACHWDGLTDNVIWAFEAGPRKSISLDGTFSKDAAHTQRVLNFSALFDEVQDFDANMLKISGGTGLLPGLTATTFKAPAKNGGVNSDLDDISAYCATIRTPTAGTHGQNVAAGRQVFATMNCAACHGGANWSSPSVQAVPEAFSDSDATPPANALPGLKVIRHALFDIGTFDATTEIRPVKDAAGNVTKKTALGNEGFNPPSLLGAFSHAPFLHNGKATTIEDVLSNPKHMAAGNGATLSAADKAALAAFIRAIDNSTPTFPITPLAAAGGTATNK